ncbi:MAG: peptidoglycan-binding protein [Clostridia bacterium]|nr:peptidoglycan-binding protein [Clostridia bacterium]
MYDISQKSEAVRELQRYLRTIEGGGTEPSSVTVDGVYGDSTRRAVREQQARAGLPVTGITDRRTWDMIYLEYLDVINSAPTPLFAFPLSPPVYSILPGSGGAPVRFLKLILAELTQYYGFAPIPDSDVYDTETEAAIRYFQSLNGLRETGEADLDTRNRLVSEYNRIITRYTG